jgi:hypothetical protein
MEENAIIEQSEVPAEDDSWKMRTLLIGAAVGALTGLGAAFLLTKRAEQKGTSLAISPGKGAQLGVMLAGLLRSIMTLGED